MSLRGGRSFTRMIDSAVLWCGPWSLFREVGGHICVWSLLVGLPGPPSGGDVPGGVDGGEDGDGFPCVGEGLCGCVWGSGCVAGSLCARGVWGCSVLFLVAEGACAWFAVVHGGVLSVFSAARCWVAVGAESDGVS